MKADAESGGLIPVHKQKIDKCKLLLYSISIASRSIACYFLSKSAESYGMSWRRVLVFAYVAVQFAFLMYQKATDVEARRRGYTIVDNQNPNTKQWWKSYQHIFLLVAVGYVNFDEESFVAWLAADICVSCLLFIYYRVYRVHKLR